MFRSSGVLLAMLIWSAFLSMLIPATGHAAVSPLSIGIVPPVQFPPDDFDVTGLRASVIYGQHRSFYGLDFGLIGNITEQTFVGIGVAGAFNYTKGPTTSLGLQLAGLTNYNAQKYSGIGLQAAVLANINKGESSMYGFQVALANLSAHTKVYGAQIGVYNTARVVNGFQIGLINRTQNLRGLQIGLVNFHAEGVFSVSPILNFGF